MTKPQAVISDIDKTLCDTSGIWHLVEEGLKTQDFSKFSEASKKCPPIRATLADLRHALEQGYYLFLVTARNEKYRHITIEWMREHFVNYDGLLMRIDGDTRPDRVVKEEMLEVLQEKFEIVHAWEDQPEIVELWESKGIPVTVVQL